MLREVRAGAVWTITDHGEPIAEVRPLRTGPWVPSEDVAELLRELGSDEAWAAELAEDRRHVELRDPWDAIS
jgi:antitoxin (DNA-binding transcriptional repressor) of toxin-antitoxin stability system